MASPSIDRRLGLAGNTAIKAPVKVATTANITLSGEQTIDGVSCVSGDRVLVRSQTSSIDNGIWDVNTGAWSRSIDFNSSVDVVQGTLVQVTQGTIYGGVTFRVSTSGEIVPGTTAISFQTTVIATNLLTHVVSVFDYMTAAQIADVTSRTASIDVTSCFQAAHDGLPSSGGAIFVPDGTYLLNATTQSGQFQITKNNVRVFGAGWGTVLRHTSTGTVTGIQSMIWIRPPASNVVICDLTVQGPSASTGGAIPVGNYVGGILVHDSTETDMENITIERVLAEKFEGNAIGSSSGVTHRVDGLTITNCVVRNTRGDGIAIFAGKLRDVLISNNRLYQCDGFPIEIAPCEGLTVIGNHISRSGQAGIGIEYNSTMSPTHCVAIVGNTIEDMTTTGYPNSLGISLGQSQNPINTLIAGNTIMRTGGYGINVNLVPNNVQIIGNSIIDIGGGGTNKIAINIGAGTNLRVTNNSIITSTSGYAMTYGVALAGTGSATNTVSDNDVIGATIAISANSPTKVICNYPPVSKFTATSNTGAAETDLLSFTIPAYKLPTDDMGCHILAWGTTAANASNKRARLYFGGSVILDSTSLAANNKPWRMEAYVWRVSATSARSVAWGEFNGSLIATNTLASIGGKDFTAGTIVKATGTGAADADITQNGLLIEYINQPSNA